jgi:SAM-dependent methyltransferase
MTDERPQRPAEAPPVDNDVTPDGSPVAVYRVLPANGEPELIHASIPANASVLELACGTGRVAGGLARLGHEVFGVDDSPGMIDAMDPDVAGVLGDARKVRLGRRFDAVLLLSHLLNDPEPDPFVETATAHLEPGGTVVGEVYPPDFDWSSAIGRSSRLGPVEITLQRARTDGPEIDAEVSYRLGDSVWNQPFVARARSEDELKDLLGRHGVQFDRWLDRPGWFTAQHSTGGGGKD